MTDQLTSAFDPYYEWLGIPNEQQPPNFYRLLGIEEFESSAKVIGSAADQRMLLLRTFQSGAQGEASQELLNEVAQARVCLLNDEAKAAYDARLRDGLSPDAEEVSHAVPESTPAEPSRVVRNVVLASCVAVLAIGLTALGFAMGVFGKSDQERSGDNPGESDQVAGPPPISREPDASTNTGNPEDAGSKPDPSPADQLPQAPTGKSKVPTPAEQQKRLKQLSEIFRPRYEKATGLAQAADREASLSALAKEILKIGRDSNDDLVARFVLFRVARDIATESSDVSLTFEAIHQLDREFDIDAMTMKKAALTQWASRVLSTSKRKDLAELIQHVAKTAISQERYELGSHLLRLAQQNATKARAVPLAAALTRDIAENKQIAEQYKQVRAAIKKLRDTPKDPESNRIAGEYLCFIRGQWQAGLKLLAHSSNEQLKLLAEKERAAPESGPARVAIGDAWWDQRAAYTAQHAKNAVLRRAVYWYRRALTDVSGLAKARIEKRLQDVDLPPLQFYSPYLAAKRTTDLLKVVDLRKDTVKGEWFFRSNALSSRAFGSTATIRFRTKAPKAYRIRAKVTRVSGNNAFGIGFILDGHQCLAVLDAHDSRYCGLAFVNGKGVNMNETATRGGVLARGKAATIELTVRPGSVEIVCSRRSVLQWQGDAKTLSLNPTYPASVKDCFFISSVKSVFRVSEFSLIELDELPVIGGAR